MRAVLLVAALAVLPALSVAAPLPTLPATVPHGPILIQGDAGFNAANGVLGGTGTEADPYVIAGWDVLAIPGGADGIHLIGTRAHVVIRDVTVHEGDPDHPTSYCRYNLGIQCNPLPGPAPANGIVLDKAENVTIEHSKLYRNGIGLLAINSAVKVRDTEVLGKVDLVAEECASLWPVSIFPRPFPRYLSLHSAPPAGIVARNSVLDVAGGRVACVAAGVYGEGSAAAVRGTTFIGAGDAVMFWESTLDVDGVAVDGANFAFTFAYGTTGTLRDSRASGAVRAAWICGEGTDVLAEGNVFEDGLGPDAGATGFDVGGTPGCPGAPTAVLRGNTVGAGYAGVHWADSPGAIEDNTFTAGHWYGIYTQFASPRIAGNVVEGYDQGIIARCHDGAIEGNRVAGNGMGVYVYQAGFPACFTIKPVVRGNAISGSAAFDLVNTDDFLYTADPAPGTNVLDARDNYWGSAAGPNMAKVRGAALLDPWRTAP